MDEQRLEARDRVDSLRSNHSRSVSGGAQDTRCALRRRRRGPRRRTRRWGTRARRRMGRSRAPLRGPRLRLGRVLIRWPRCPGMEMTSPLATYKTGARSGSRGSRPRRPCLRWWSLRRPRTRTRGSPEWRLRRRRGEGVPRVACVRCVRVRKCVLAVHRKRCSVAPTPGDQDKADFLARLPGRPVS